MPDTFGDLRAQFDDLVGLDLEDTERDALLNEGHRKLATESEWYKAERELGPTVADQAAYALPTDVYRVLELEVGGYEYKPGDRKQIARLNRHEIVLTPGTAGLWWRSYSSSNVQQISLYPTPGTAGTSIIAYVIERPALMTDDADVPVVPEEFRQAIVDYAAGIGFGGDEDNADMRVFYQDQFDRRVIELRKMAWSTGRAVTSWAIEGWTN